MCLRHGRCGAGKTELLAQKAAYLLQTGICPAPQRVLAISFKRDAAATLGARVRLRLPEGQRRRFVSLTFDAWTKGMLDQFRRALPVRYAPPADYRVDFPTRDSLNAQLTKIGSDLNRSSLRTWSPPPGAVGGAGPSEQARKDARSVLARSVRRLRDAAADLRDDQPARGMHAAPARRHTGGPSLDLPVRVPGRVSGHDVGAVRARQDGVLPETTRITTVGDDKQRIMGWAGRCGTASGRSSRPSARGA